MTRHLQRSLRLMHAFSLTEIMAVSAIVTSIPTAQYAMARQKAVETACRMNLQQIGQMIVMYHLAEGTYPKAVLYPKDAREDADGIVRVLEGAGYAVPREMWVCPAAPKELGDRGLTFLYNEKVGGKSTVPNPSRTWLLIEMTCVSKRVPHPHPGGYNVLCADGRVLTTTTLPPDLQKLQQARLPGTEGKATRLRTTARTFLAAFPPAMPRAERGQAIAGCR